MKKFETHLNTLHKYIYIYAFNNVIYYLCNYEYKFYVLKCRREIMCLNKNNFNIKA